jgi:hypothetical protein
MLSLAWKRCLAFWIRARILADTVSPVASLG